jgi:hypothetical protein
MFCPIHAGAGGDHVVFAELLHLGRGARGTEQAGVRMHHALGRCGGAGSEEHAGDVAAAALVDLAIDRALIHLASRGKKVTVASKLRLFIVAQAAWVVVVDAQ